MIRVGGLLDCFQRHIRHQQAEVRVTALVPHRKVTSWLTLAIALVFAAVTMFGVITYRNTIAVRRGESLIARSYAVREATRELLSSVKDMETGQRGFLITGRRSYLEPYQAALERVEDVFSRLQTLTHEHPHQQQRLGQLRQLVHDKQAVLAEAIKLRIEDSETEGFAEARAAVVDSRDNVLMNEMRKVVNDMLEEEQRRLTANEAAARSRAVTSQRFIVAGNLITLVLLLLSGFAAHVDRTRRDAAEAELRFSQAELGAIFDSAGEGIITFGDDFRIRLMNPAAANMHGADAMASLGKSLLDLIPPQRRPAVTESIHDFLQSQQRTRDFPQGLSLRHDGSEFPSAGSLAKTPTGSEQLITLMLRDLSESQARETTIRQQVEILHQVHDAILVCDMDDRIQFWNRGAESLYGYAPQRVMGQNLVQLLFRDLKTEWETGRAAILKDGLYVAELPQQDQAGQDILVEHRRSLILDDDGQPHAQLILHLDITARRAAEIHLRRAQRLESIGTLAGGISHDLNNVLTPILMSAKLLQRGVQQQERLLDVIVSGAERGSQMIQKLLSFAGGERGSRERIEVRDIISETEMILRHTLPKEIQLRVVCNDHLNPVSGNATELSQVLMNLAINARDAMPDGGELTLKAENVDLDAGARLTSDKLRPGSHLLITVADTGHGIAPENMERIFEPFFTTKDQGKGTGLGLATSLGIVRSCGGDMMVQSHSGQGTSIAIYLPTAAAEDAAAPLTNFANQHRGHNESILLVDDEPLIVETARVTLEANGYRVATAHGGAEAIAYYQQHTDLVDAAVIDLMMPVMDGFATIDALRKINPRLPIIASSGVRRPATDGQRLSDMNGFLAKPYSDAELLAAVRGALEATLKPAAEEL